MNKKFSTLMLGLLLTSAFASAAELPENLQQVNFGEKGVVSGTYFVIAEGDGNSVVSDGDYVLFVSANNGDLTYSTEKVSNVSFSGDMAAYTWSFEANKEGSTNPQYFYALKNSEAGAYLTYSGTSLVNKVSESQKAEKNKSLFYSGTTTTAWTNGKVLKTYTGDDQLIVNEGGVSFGTTGTAIYLCNLASQLVSAEDLNDVKGGEGFNLKFSAGNTYEWANDNLSDLNLKAFYVNITDWKDPKFDIPVGTYFATSYPASLNNENVITKREDFMACTFLAINPDVNNSTAADRKAGKGFELTTVAASDLNVYEDQTGDQASVKGEVYVGNACFSVTAPDPLNNDKIYNIAAPYARVLVDASKTEHKAFSDLYVGLLTSSSKKNYISTVTEQTSALSFETTNTTLYDVTELLKSEDAPSIYTIQFVSELYKDEATNFAGEKGQYLTVSKQDISSSLSLTSVVDIDATDPMFQFVITDVNKDSKTVTFTNRQSSASVEVSLYKNADGSYTVYNDNATLYVEKADGFYVNESVEFNPNPLQGTKVVLTPVTVEDKFASFVNRADDAGLVTFELAKNVDDTPEFYVGAKRGNNGDIEEVALRGYSNSKNMTQFELVKVYKDAKKNPWTVTNSYVYKNGSRVLTSTAQDTVAYYKYAIKVFGEEIDYYVTHNYTLEKATTSTTPDAFIIKNNLDGSISLMKDVYNYAYVNQSLPDNYTAWSSKNYYDLPSHLNGGLKTFMVGEDPVLSYEAIPQHVSFEAVRGGFMTKDENNDARLAITNVAAEDLTFWLDTVDSDQNIPSFYVLKNGAFMYNATDSATYYYDKRNNDRFNIDKYKAKLIFKAGELVTSDTLRTTVDGQSVLVAEKDNAPKGIKGGLKNFQFQIIQAEAGSDEYILRQGAQYVCQLNNYFYVGGNKDAAYRFVIEKQAAPTANEGIEVSEVKVIAGNGQITIMGAAGKQVVVSNILGKVVANQMITTDNATIAVPAGIIAVAVEGEAAVKAIVK